MLKNRALYLVVLISLILVSCNSSKKLLERGAYYQSVMAAVKKLQRSPNNKKSQRALLHAYPLARQDLLEEIERAKSNAVPMPWTSMTYTYESLNTMYKAIKASPKARQIIRNPQEYYKQYAAAKSRAAVEQYEAGIRFMKKGSRQDAKEAYFYFQRADAFKPGYKDVDRKLREAKELATLKVVVETVPVPSRYFKVSADLFYDEVDKHLRDIMRRNQFVAFYAKQDARQRGLTDPDQVLTLRFEDFTVGQSKYFQNKETVTRDSVKVGEIKAEDGTKKPILGTVSAKVVTRRLEVLSGGILSMTIRDGHHNTRLYRDEMTGEFLWFAEWGSFQGDERALNEEQVAVCKRVEMKPPMPQALFAELTKPIYEQLTGKLNRRYLE